MTAWHNTGLVILLVASLFVLAAVFSVLLGRWRIRRILRRNGCQVNSIKTSWIPRMHGGPARWTLGHDFRVTYRDTEESNISVRCHCVDMSIGDMIWHDKRHD